MRGRKPTSSVIRQIEGDRRKQAKDQRQPDLKAFGLPAVQSDLVAEEREAFERARDSLPDGLLVRADSDLLERYATLAHIFVEVRREARLPSPKGRTKYRHTVVSNRGESTNARMNLLMALSRELRLLGAEFGLSPVSRVRLATTDLGREVDPLELLLQDQDPDSGFQVRVSQPTQPVQDE